VTSQESLDDSLEKAAKHYSSLFLLPSYKMSLFLLALFCLSGGLLSGILLMGLGDFEGVLKGIILGVSLFSMNLIADFSVTRLALRQDPIYNLRRTTALSFFCWLLWLFFVLVGVVMALFFGLSWWIKLYLLGFSSVLIFRLIIFSATVSISYKRLLVVSFLQPFSCVFPFLVLCFLIEGLSVGMLLFLIYAPIIGFFSSFFFVFLLNSVGRQTLGVPSFSLFKAFLLNWISGLNAPLEKLLEKLGQEKNVEISMIKFDASKPKAIMAIPSIHPGPFKNIGSSLLPLMLKTELERKFNCNVCVPHGLLGHEFDLVSQDQNQKVINHVLTSASFGSSSAMACPFVEVSNGLATACCQIFGNLVFFSFTLAPNTIEDLPNELGLFVNQEAEKRGLRLCAVVNAHNSINGKVDMQKALTALETVAVACLDKAVSLKQLHFEVGAATVLPKEFSLKDGMGLGGITVVTVRMGDQKTAYVVIDGNNMVSGLRDKILSALYSAGINNGEVFTTDTHSVNALTLSKRGYNPIGEAIDHEKLIRYIKEATLDSLSSLEPAKAACCKLIVHDAKVIGEKQLESLSLLSDRTIKQAKKIMVPIFATSGFLLMAFLMFI
jgi:putative membrane protein